MRKRQRVIRDFIRIPTTIADDPGIAAIAKATGLSVEVVIGLVVRVFGVMMRHCPDGNISAYGPDGINWLVGYERKRTKRYGFGPAFLAHMCDVNGVCTMFTEGNVFPPSREIELEWKRAKRDLDIAAIQTMCQPCNSSKGARLH